MPSLANRSGATEHTVMDRSCRFPQRFSPLSFVDLLPARNYDRKTVSDLPTNDRRALCTQIKFININIYINACVFDRFTGIFIAPFVQDTVITLYALSQMAERITPGSLRLTTTFSYAKNVQSEFQVTKDNAMTLQLLEVSESCWFFIFYFFYFQYFRVKKHGVTRDRKDRYTDGFKGFRTGSFDEILRTINI